MSTRNVTSEENAMYETHVTVVGNVATPINPRRLPDGTIVANFRVGASERRYDRAAGGWVDGDRLYIDVQCWRKLAQNTMGSLVKGDAVVVTGRLYTREYEHDGQRRSIVTLNAHTVAADLSHCTAVVTRNRKASAPEQTAPTSDDSDGGRGGSVGAGEGRPADENGSAGGAADAARQTDVGFPRLVGAVPDGQA
jgi:single-strand DNA-binding protein